MKMRFRSLRTVFLFMLAGAALPVAAQYEPTTPQGQAQAVNAQNAANAAPSVADPRSRAKIHTELGALYFQAGNPAAALEHLALSHEAAPAGLDEALFEGSLAEALSRVERLMLARLYPQHPSTRQLARRLGLSHTAVANKLRQYGIGGSGGNR